MGDKEEQQNNMPFKRWYAIDFSLHITEWYRSLEVALQPETNAKPQIGVYLTSRMHLPPCDEVIRNTRIWITHTFSHCPTSPYILCQATQLAKARSTLLFLRRLMAAMRPSAYCCPISGMNNMESTLRCHENVEEALFGTSYMSPGLT